MVDEIVSLIQRTLGDHADMSGAVLYNGSSTLKSGRFYLMGLNPGGDPQKESTSVVQSIKNQFRCDPRYSSYLDEKWPGSRHQPNVIRLASALETDLRDIFSANAIFVRSKNAKLLPSDAFELASLCWPVHEYFLSQVRPEIILCLGNGDGVSSFSLLRRLINSTSEPFNFVHEKKFRDGKYFKAEIRFKSDPSVKPLNCLVVGVPHPSWHQPSEKLIAFLKTQISERNE